MTAFIHPNTLDDNAADEPLFVLADNEANGNKQRGHIALLPPDDASAQAYFVDLGPVLKFTAQFGGAMTPDVVRQLAAELLEWADRKEPTKPAPLRELVDLLAELGCRSYSLHATDQNYWSARQPDKAEAKRIDLRLMVVGRTEFERIAQRLGAKVTERIVHAGQRAWHAEADTDTRRLLIEAVSFQHHDDWEPR